MLKNIEIRLATIDDLSALEKAGKKLFDNAVKPNRAKEFLSDSRHHLVVAFHQKEAIGMASAFHYVHPDKDPMLFVNEVSVLEDFQNRKIGRGLVRFLVKHGSSLGCREAWIATEKSNVAAQKAYLAAGGVKADDSVVLFEFTAIDFK